MNKEENLRMVYQQMHSLRMHYESIENKFTLAFVTASLIFSGLILRKEIELNGASVYFAKGMVTFIFFVSMFYLYKTAKINTESRTILVRIEQALGLFTDSEYISKEQVDNFYRKPFAEATIIPPIFSDFFMPRGAFSITPNAIAIVASYICIISVIKYT